MIRTLPWAGLFIGRSEEVIANEAWDRMSRLLDHKVVVSVRINIATQFGDEHTQGYDAIAEIPGRFPRGTGNLLKGSRRICGYYKSAED